MYFIQNNTKIVLKDGKTHEEITLLDTKEGVTGHVVAGLPYLDVIDDSLDSFVFTLKNYPRRKAFPPFSLVTYTIDDGIKPETTTLFVQFDKVQSYSRLDKNNLTYVHTVSCVESAKILEKTKIFNLNLTNQSDTLLRQFEKACVNVEPILDNREVRFQLSENLKTFLDGKPSGDFYFGNTDFRSVLDSMLSLHNARITVERVEYDSKGNIKTIYLGYIAMTKIADVSPVWTEDQQGEITWEGLENSGQDYAGKVVGRGYNSKGEEAIEFTDTFKTANETLSDKNAMVLLPFPISDKGFKKFAIKVLAQYKNYGYDSSIKNLYVWVDITSSIIPQEQYDLLSDEQRKNYISYTIGATSVFFGQCHSLLFGWQETNMTEIIKKFAPPKLPENEEYSFLGALDAFSNFIFTCSYYPQIDAVADISKPGVYDKNTLLMGIMDSQTEQTLDIDRHGKKLAGLIQRTGNTEYVIDVEAKYYSKLLPIMSRIDLPNATDDEERDFVLYKREYSVFDNLIKCRYYFSQHYNAVQNNAGVNREKHLFDIPLESDETPIVVKKQLCFSFDGVNETIAEYKFGSELLYAAVETLFGYTDSMPVYNTGDKKLKYLLWQSVGGDGKTDLYTHTYPQDTENASGEKPYTDSDYRFVLPLCNYAHAKTMNFAARVLDNYSVSYSRDGYRFSIWGDGGNMMSYNRYVEDGVYVDEDGGTINDPKYIGECHTFKLGYAFDLIESEDTLLNPEKEKIQHFPVANKDHFNSAMKNIGSAPIVFQYYKDRTQRPLFVLQLECIPDEAYKNDIIIGTEFAKNNNLVNNGGKGLSLILYASKKYTFNGDETMITKSMGFDWVGNPMIDFSLKKGVTTEGTPYAQLVYGNSYKDNEIVTSWAFVDTQGNIYLACNGKLRDIYVFAADLLQ